MHAVDPHQVKANARWLTQYGIFEEFVKFKKANTTNWITFSGGNPCIHDLSHLVDLLHSFDQRIHVETQGTFCPNWLRHCESVCVSPKTPGMGEKLELEKLDDFTFKMSSSPTNFSFKMVVFDQRDLEVASMIYERYILTGLFRPDQFYLSLGNPYPPGKDENIDRPTRDFGVNLPEILLGQYRRLLPDVMQDKNLCNAKFLPQLHVLLWDNKQGV